MSRSTNNISMRQSRRIAGLPPAHGSLSNPGEVEETVDYVSMSHGDNNDQQEPTTPPGANDAFIFTSVDGPHLGPQLSAPVPGRPNLYVRPRERRCSLPTPETTPLLVSLAEDGNLGYINSKALNSEQKLPVQETFSGKQQLKSVPPVVGQQLPQGCPMVPHGLHQAPPLNGQWWYPVPPFAGPEVRQLPFPTNLPMHQEQPTASTSKQFPHGHESGMYVGNGYVPVSAPVHPQYIPSFIHQIPQQQYGMSSYVHPPYPFYVPQVNQMAKPANSRYNGPLLRAANDGVDHAGSNQGNDTVVSGSQRQSELAKDDEVDLLGLLTSSCGSDINAKANSGTTPVLQYKLVPSAPGLNKAIEEADKSKIFDDPWCGSEDERTFMEFKISLTSAAPYTAATYDIQRYALIWVHLDKSIRATLETQRTYRFGVANWSGNASKVLQEYWLTLEEEYARPSDRARILNRWNALRVEDLEYVLFTKEFNALILHVEAIQGHALSDEDRRSKIYNAVDQIAQCYIDEVLPSHTSSRELNSKLLSHYDRRRIEQRNLVKLAKKENAMFALNADAGLNAMDEKTRRSDQEPILTGEWSNNPALKVYRGQLYVNYDILKSLKVCFRCFKNGHDSENCEQELPTFCHLRCHACGKTGHKQTECLWLKRYKIRQDQQRMCGRCGKGGHLPGICRGNKEAITGARIEKDDFEGKDQQGSKLSTMCADPIMDDDLCTLLNEQGGESSLHGIDEGPLYVTMKFGDGEKEMNMKVMIDTGAGRSYCKASLISSLKKCGWNMQVIPLTSPIKVKLADGHAIIVYNMVEIQCFTRGGLKPIQLCIMDTMTSEVILGMDTLRNISFGLCLSPSKVETKTGVCGLRVPINETVLHSIMESVQCDYEDLEEGEDWYLYCDAGYVENPSNYTPIKSCVDDNDNVENKIETMTDINGTVDGLDPNSYAYMDTLFLGVVESEHWDEMGRKVTVQRMMYKLPWKGTMRPPKMDMKDVLVHQKKDEKRQHHLKELGYEDQYEKILREYADLHIIEPVKEAESVIYALNHRPVIRPGAVTSKVRPVYNGAPLSKYLYRGLIMDSNLLPGLLLWRMYGFVASLDVSKAFLMLLLAPYERRFLNFCHLSNWWRFTRVPMGLISSPSLLQHSMKLLLNKVQEALRNGYYEKFIEVPEYHLQDVYSAAARSSKSPVKSEISDGKVQMDIGQQLGNYSMSKYMDDVLIGATSMEKLNEVVEVTKRVFRDHGMNINFDKCVCSSGFEGIHSFLGVKWLPRDTISMNVSPDIVPALPVQEIPGMNIQEVNCEDPDEIDYLDYGDKRKFKTSYLTVRDLLSFSHSLYDPLGLYLSDIMQTRLWLRYCNCRGWTLDENIPLVIHRNMINMIHRLQSQEGFPRYFASKLLYVACDSSTYAWAVTVHDEQGQVLLQRGGLHTKNHMTWTIVRKELLSIIMGVDMASKIVDNVADELKGEIGLRFLTDNQCNFYRITRAVSEWKDGNTPNFPEVDTWENDKLRSLASSLVALPTPWHLFYIPGDLNMADAPTRAQSERVVDMRKLREYLGSYEKKN